MEYNKLKYLLAIFLFIFSVSNCFAKGNTLPYNYNGVDYYTIVLTPNAPFSTKNEIIDGQPAEFRVCYNVYVKGKLFLKQGDIVEATVEMAIYPGRKGVPAEIYLDNFKIPNAKPSQLICEQNIIGHHKWWLKAIKPLTVPGFCLAPAFYFIRGGHAKLKENDTIKVLYFPDWK